MCVDIMLNQNGQTNIIIISILSKFLYTHNVCYTHTQYCADTAEYSKENLLKIKGHGIPLDHNHTHFLLVDDGTVGISGTQVLKDFRLQLESYISKTVEIGITEKHRDSLQWTWGN